jgi:multisubunit Na+/H+ antiporter MnhF subunit
MAWPLILYHTSEVLIGLSALLCLVRAVLGPSIFDRALAIDSLALTVVGYLLLRSYAPGERLYTDAALGLALFAFVGTVLMAHFLGEGDYPGE